VTSHAPLTQTPVVQWELSEQLQRQNSASSHVSPPAQRVSVRVHAPSLAHVPTISVAPTQMLPHVEPVGFRAHAPPEHIEHGPSAQRPCGSALPSGTFTQTPRVIPHERHAPVHSVAQQYPSAQIPVPHSLDAAHG
jgi:hypothetical protein